MSAKRVGRPRTREGAGDRAEYLGGPVGPELSKKVEAAAELSRRSKSAEMRARLEASFLGGQHLLEAWSLTFGPQLAVALAVTGRAVSEINRGVPFPQTWADDRVDEASWAACKIFGAFGIGPDLVDDVDWSIRNRPADEAVAARAAGVIVRMNRIVIAPGIVAKLLVAVKNPAQGAPELRAWAQPLHAVLGEAAARLRIDEIQAQMAWVQQWATEGDPTGKAPAAGATRRPRGKS